MPIGTSKVGALGGLVPGGSVTFNTSGNWDVPPGVKIVSIEGKGSTGNPGNPGNAGNAGDIGTGGGGGAGGATQQGPTPNSPGQIFAGCGGRAWSGRCGNFSTNFTAGGTNNASNPPAGPYPGNPGSTGSTGPAGNAGNAGNPGNAGNASSGLGNNFPGGAAGNAGVAGNAGNGGSGGNGGGGGQGAPTTNLSTGNGGSGGNGGGSGAPGRRFLPVKSPPNPGQQLGTGGAGGGGAGATNDGASALLNVASPPSSPGQESGSFAGRGGTTANYSFPTLPCSPYVTFSTGCPVGANTTGGLGGQGPRNAYPPLVVSTGGCSGPASISNTPGISGVSYRTTLNQGNGMFTPFPTNSPAYPAIRSGGGGSAGNRTPSSPAVNGSFSGGGGGGGRGNAGNAGGAGGAGGTGGTANPTTFNCVPVTPGSTTPIVVASPGGQVVISWNPQ